MHGESARHRRHLGILQLKPAQSVEAKQICSSEREEKGHLEAALVTMTGAFLKKQKNTKAKESTKT